MTTLYTIMDYPTGKAALHRHDRAGTKLMGILSTRKIAEILRDGLIAEEQAHLRRIDEIIYGQAE